MTIEFEICWNKLTAENEKCIAQSPLRARIHTHTPGNICWPGWYCIMLTSKLHEACTMHVVVVVVLFFHLKCKTYQFFPVCSFLLHVSFFSFCYEAKKEKKKKKKQKKTLREMAQLFFRLLFLLSHRHGILILFNFEFKQIINIAK